ncbi:hypothetical protein PMG11_03733 [Penicillium brasilianum]|uniref:Uncharacterized protein n=1 Tax=Penicillium brasilianum TaxID=104259 RepID=A0A0F7VAW6_PENBI|nr:hypothetical protein PMG11_03733 [Penicillium brasilianum]
MAERKRIHFTYQTVEGYSEFDRTVRQIISEDTGQESWIATRSLPPTNYPPPLTPNSIDRIKNLSEDIVVSEIAD